MAEEKVIPQLLSRVCEIVGFLLLLISAVFFEKSLLWPSAYTMIPVIGAVFILLASRGGVGNNK